MERVVEIDKVSFENDYETSLRPNTWEDYIGQEKIKKNLQVFIKASKNVKRHLIMFCFLDLLDLVKPL